MLYKAFVICSTMSSPTSLPLFIPLQPPWHLCCSWNIPSIFLLYTCYSPGCKSSPLGIHMPDFHTFIRSWLKCHLTGRHSLVSLVKIILPWCFLFPIFFLCTYLHLPQYIFHLLLLLIVYHSSIECKLHKGRELCIFFFSLLCLKVPRTACGT